MTDTSVYRKPDTDYTVRKMAPGSLLPFLPSLLMSSDVLSTIIRQCKAYAKQHLGETASSYSVVNTVFEDNL